MLGLECSEKLWAPGTGTLPSWY